MLEAIKKQLNTKFTENGSPCYSSTMNNVLDMFAFGASYRQRSDADVVTLFQNALLQDETLAMKCLFWIRDVRGAGERRFFRVCMKWLAFARPEIALRNLPRIPEYGRFDDLYVFVDTPLQNDAMKILCEQLQTDNVSNFPSLAGKWAKSCNTSSAESRRLGELTRSYLHMTSRDYRLMLSRLRARLKVLEKLMSSKNWDEIDFDKIPSIAGMRYSHCFSTREELKKRYAEFMNRPNTKVNASVLYPYECTLDEDKTLAMKSFMMDKLDSERYSVIS